jgi:hypothetical protein
MRLHFSWPIFIMAFVLGSCKKSTIDTPANSSYFLPDKEVVQLKQPRPSAHGDIATNSVAGSFQILPLPDAHYVASTNKVTWNHPYRSIINSISDGNLTVNFSSELQVMNDGYGPSWENPPYVEEPKPLILLTSYNSSTITLSKPVKVFGFEFSPNSYTLASTWTAEFYSGNTFVGQVTKSYPGSTYLVGVARLIAASTDATFDKVIIEFNSGDAGVGGMVFSQIRYAEYDPISVNFDMYPRDCKNHLNVRSTQVSYAAIYGTNDFDATTINRTTVKINGVSPIYTRIADLASPFVKNNPCDCAVTARDRTNDLELRFETWVLAATFPEVAHNQTVPITITGKLNNGTYFEGTDCVVIKRR